MTVETTTNTQVARGNGVTTSWPFGFKVLDASHLVIRRRVFTTGVIDKTYSLSEVTVTGIGDSAGGTVEITPALSDTYEVIISRTVPYKQELDIVNQGGFFPDTVEQQLDLMEMQTQQISNKVDRAIIVPEGEDGGLLPIKSLRANKFATYDLNGDPTVSDGALLLPNIASNVDLGNGRTVADISAVADITIYVDAAGSDLTGDGSAANKYATPQKAIDAALPYLTVRQTVEIIVTGNVTTSSRSVASMQRPALLCIDGVKIGQRSDYTSATNTVRGGLILDLSGATFEPSAAGGYPIGIYATGYCGRILIRPPAWNAGAGATELIASHNGAWLHIVGGSVGDANASIGLYAESGGAIEANDVTVTGSTVDVSATAGTFIQLAAPLGLATVGSISNTGHVDLAVGIQVTGTITNRGRLTFTGTAGARVVLTGNYSGKAGTVYGAYVDFASMAASIVANAEIWDLESCHSDAQFNLRAGSYCLPGFQSFTGRQAAPNDTKSSWDQPIRLLDGAKLSYDATINNLNSSGNIVGADYAPTTISIAADASTIKPEVYKEVQVVRLLNTKGSAVTGTILSTSLLNWLAGTVASNEQVLIITCDDAFGIEIVPSTTITGIPEASVVLGEGAGLRPGMVLRYSATTGKWRVVALAPKKQYTGQAEVIDFVGTPNASHTGDTATTTLATVTLPAGIMGKYGHVEVIANWGASGTAGTKTVTTKFGGTIIQTSAQGATTLSIRTFTDIANNGAENAQLAPAAQTGTTGFGGAVNVPLSLAIDTTAAVDILFTGALSNAADTITLQSYIIRVHRRTV